MADGSGERTKTRDVDDLLADVDEITGTGNDSQSGGSSDRTRTTTPIDTSTSNASTTAESDGSGLRQRLGGAFSITAFVIALVLTAVGSGLGGFIPLIGGPLAFAGIFLATFLLGTVSSRRHYVEAGLSAGLVAGASALGNHVYLAFIGGNGPILIGGLAAIGVVCGVLGHYFGRDLRDGFTRDL